MPPLAYALLDTAIVTITQSSRQDSLCMIDSRSANARNGLGFDGA